VVLVFFCTLVRLSAAKIGHYIEDKLISVRTHYSWIQVMCTKTGQVRKEVMPGFLLTILFQSPESPSIKSQTTQKVFLRWIHL